MPVGEGERARALELAAQRVVAPLRGLNRFALQVLEVVLHPAQRVFRRAFERGIERGQRRDDPAHLFVDDATGRGQRFLDLRWNLRLQQLVQRAVVLRLQRLERHVVLREKPHRARVEDGGGGAAVHQRHRNAEALVDIAQLAEVREFVRPGDITNRRQHRVLHERPQEDARAEAGRLVRGLAHEIGGLLNRTTSAVETEEGDAVLIGRLDLCVISAGGQIGAGGGGKLRRLAGCRELAGKEVADERLGRRVGCVVNDEAAVAQHAFEHAAERGGHADARCVGGAEVGEK